LSITHVTLTKTTLDVLIPLTDSEVLSASIVNNHDKCSIKEDASVAEKYVYAWVVFYCSQELSCESFAGTSLSSKTISQVVPKGSDLFHQQDTCLQPVHGAIFSSGQ
jgi:hypothetical protein